MITRTHRFHGYNSLRHVYRLGEVVRSPHISLKYLASPKTPSYRAAVVVSRKVHKTATVRNRIRRRVYEAIRGCEPDIKPGYDLVFTVFSERLAEMPAPELQQTVSGLLGKAHVMKPAPLTSGHAIVKGKET